MEIEELLYPAEYFYIRSELMDAFGECDLRTPEDLLTYVEGDYSASKLNTAILWMFYEGLVDFRGDHILSHKGQRVKPAAEPTPVSPRFLTRKELQDDEFEAIWPTVIQLLNTEDLTSTELVETFVQKGYLGRHVRNALVRMIDTGKLKFGPRFRLVPV